MDYYSPEIEEDEIVVDFEVKRVVVVDSDFVSVGVVAVVVDNVNLETYFYLYISYNLYLNKLFLL